MEVECAETDRSSARLFSSEKPLKSVSLTRYAKTAIIIERLPRAEVSDEKVRKTSNGEDPRIGDG